MAARLVVSETGDILSPKLAPETTIPATSARGMPSASPNPISTTPMVAIVPQAVPVASDIKLHSIKPDGKKK